MSNDGLKPSCWGATAWHFLHSVAMGYPENIDNTPENQIIANHYKTFFETLEFILPCEWCKIHYKANLKNLPISPYLTGRRNLSLWLYMFHNLVNDETNVPEINRPSFEEIYDLYNGYRVPCDEDSKTCGGSDKDLCHIIIKNIDPYSYSYWPFMLLIMLLLIIIATVCLKIKKRK